MAVTLTQLAAFLAVVRRGSVTAAARELVVTQPSVSSAVAALEREVGVELTERVGRTVCPTAAGASYAPYAAEVLGLLEAGCRAAREAAGHEHRSLRISAVTTAAEYIVPPLIREFADRHPEFEISLGVGNREEVLRRLIDHRDDVAITGRPPPEANVEGRAFADNDFVLVTAVDDEFARRAAVPVEALASQPWLVREPGSGTRALCDEFLAERGLSPRIFTLGSNGAIKQAARAGLGIALQARVAVALELELGLLEIIDLAGGLPRGR
jgi:DNA-binding transcriptional LysR family regulator